MSNSQTDETAQQQVAALTAALAEAQRERDEARVAGWCDVCTGTGKLLTGERCVCGNGEAAMLVVHLRERLHAAQAEATALREALAEITARYDDYRARGVMPAPGQYGRMVEAITKAGALLGGQPPTGGQ